METLRPLPPPERVADPALERAAQRPADPATQRSHRPQAAAPGGLPSTQVPYRRPKVPASFL